MEKSDIIKLKLWIDSEFSINHVYYWAILGVLIGGKFWFVAGTFMAINLFYALRRAAKLPREYLSIKGVKRFK